jgi:hypothetical protein
LASWISLLSFAALATAGGLRAAEPVPKKIIAGCSAASAGAQRALFLGEDLPDLRDRPAD